MKKLLSAALAFAMIFAQTSCSEQKDQDKHNYIYGQIESVSGNDVLLSLAQPKEKSDRSESDDTSGSADVESSASKRSKNRSNTSGGEPAQGDDSQRPTGRKKKATADSSSSDSSSSDSSSSDSSSSDSSSSDGNAARKSRRSSEQDTDSSDSDTSASERSDSAAAKQKQKKSAVKSSSFTLTGEKKQIRIPAGVTVTTANGVDTTFDALSVGDFIRCSVQKDSDGNEVVTQVKVMQK